MVGTENLEELEKKVFEERASDGLFELILGVLFILFGVLIAYDLSVYVGIVAAFPVIFLRSLREKIVQPRLGTVLPTGKRAKVMGSTRQTVIYTILGLVLLGLLVFLLVARAGISGDTLKVLHAFHLDLFALMILVVFLMIGRMNGYSHLLAYLAGAVVVFVIRALLGLPSLLSFFVVGGILTVFGSVALVRFLKRYPLIGAENN